jgi:hypothetical protein
MQIWRLPAQPIRSASPDQNALGAPHVAEAIHVFVLHHFVDELGAVLAEPGERVVEVIHGEHDAEVAEVSTAMRPERAAGTRSNQMPRYLISFDAHAMDHIPDEDMPAVAEAAHDVVDEAMKAGVWVFGGGLENQKASIVAIDGTVTDGPYQEAVRGFCVVDVPTREEALKWAAKTADACRCAQEVREFMPDPAVGN